MRKLQRRDVTEKTVERRLRERTESADGICLKLYTMSHSGLPDRLILMPGNKFYLVETKCIKKGKPTEPSPIQKWVHRKLEKMGVKVWIVNDSETLDYFMIHITQ